MSSNPHFGRRQREAFRPNEAGRFKFKGAFDSILPSARAEVNEPVRELVWVLLKSGSCSAKRVAKHLGVDRRTINRRLASEGQSYSSIVDAVRKDTVSSFVQYGSVR